MKHLTSLLLLAAITWNASAQCDADFDFMGAEYGVAPNPELGDELELGAVDGPYHDVLHLLLPTYINDVSPSYAFNDDTLLDSLAISSVTATNLETMEVFSLSDLGLELACNNNGDSDHPCHFQGGGQYCAALQGVPTHVGFYQVDVFATAYITAFNLPFGQESVLLSLPLLIGDGCTDGSAFNYDPAATADDGSCVFNPCFNQTACNFDPELEWNEGPCVFAVEGYDCDGNCLADDNDNGICDALEVEGCTDDSACNYDASATYGDNNVLCDYSTCPVFGCTSTFACNFNPYAVYNNGTCDFLSCAGCTLPSACNYDPEASLNNGSCDFISCSGCTDPEASNYDPDALIDDGSCEILGCTNSGACNFDINATVNDGSCDFLSCLPSGCLLTAACNYDPSALVASGECIFPEDGYDCDGNCLNDTDGDGVCNPFEVPGCDDPDAFNYDPSATENNGSCVAVSLGCLDATACNYVSSANTEDGSCDYDSCVGCTQFFACNYNPDATVSSGDCVFAEFGYDCDGECLIDSDGDGVCNQFEVNGCTDPHAYNFEQEATEDDGSCILCAPLSSACGPGTYWDDVAEACLPSLSADLNLDGCVGMGDLLELLSAFGACIDD